MNPKKLLWQAILRVLSSLLVGCVFYFLWLGISLITRPRTGFIDALLWIVAPLITGAGFAYGVVWFNRLVKTTDEPFLHILAWPLSGCILGAAIVYPFGPMLIVFSMLALGTVSVSAREVLKILRRRKTRDA